MKAILFLLVLLAVHIRAGFEDFSYGGRINKIYVPSKPNSATSLFVMLHGCTQDPTDFAKGTQMNEYGEKGNFFVLYPLQPSSANSNKCWNWFEPKDQSRGSGESKLLADMTLAVLSKYPSINRDQVFVGGLSAGAAMSVIIGVNYPDIFRCVAVGAGLEYKAAQSTTQAFTAMSSGGPNPKSQGRVAYNAEGSYKQLQCVLVVHGTSDYTVRIVNAEQVITQYATTLSLILGNGQESNSLSDVPTSSQDGKVPVTSGKQYTVYDYKNNNNGKTYLKYVKVTSMGHAWSGGSNQGSYTDPTGPNASEMMISFFSEFVNNGTSTTTSDTTTSDTTTSDTTTASTDTSSSSTDTDTSSSDTSSSSTTGGLDNGFEFYSVPEESGWVGQLTADGMSNTVLLVGDKGMFNTDTYRSIISFDTSSLPANVSIAQAELILVRRVLNGTVNSINLDIKEGAFSSNNQLERADFNAAASASSIAQVGIPTQNGGSSTTALPASSLKYIKGGSNQRTQFRLISQTSASFSANAVEFFGGLLESDTNAAILRVGWNVQKKKRGRN